MFKKARYFLKDIELLGIQRRDSQNTKTLLVLRPN